MTHTLKLDDMSKETLCGVLRALGKDASRANLLYAWVRNGWIYATDGQRMHFASINGLPENGVYHVAFMPFDVVAFVPVEQKMRDTNSVIGAIRPCSTTLPTHFKSAATEFAIKSGIPFQPQFFDDALSGWHGRITAHWFPRVEGKAAEAILFDNGLWYSLVMPVRDI